MFLLYIVHNNAYLALSKIVSVHMYGCGGVLRSIRPGWNEMRVRKEASMAGYLTGLFHVVHHCM